MPTKKSRPSAAEARRRLHAQSSPGSAAPHVLDGYAPRRIDPVVWARIAPVVAGVIGGSGASGPESLRKLVTHVSLFFAWAEAEDLPLETATLSRGHIETYISRGMPESSPKSRADRRSRLRPVADRLHPQDAAPPGRVIGRAAVRPPYSHVEMALYRQAALDQPTVALRRAMCLCIGLGVGAGLASADFRSLTRRHIEDHGDLGLLVRVPTGPPNRRVPVLRDYEALVRRGLEGLHFEDLLLAGREDRRNLAARAVENALLPSSAPKLEQSRLRHTWMAHMVRSQIPLQVLLTAAGLQSARTLTDVIACLPAPSDDAIRALREAGGGL